MASLEQLLPNAAVRGILPDCLVTVVSVKWYGTEVLELIYKTPDGRLGNGLLYRHDEPRIEALWGNLMGGGSGVEWYFGSDYPHMDINLEDFRSRDRMWDQTRIALEFFQKNLPFAEMEPDNDLATGAKGARVLAKYDEIYVVQLPAGGEVSLKLGPGLYRVGWFNPLSGGAMQTGSVTTIQGPGIRSLGAPPARAGKDWIVLVKR